MLLLFFEGFHFASSTLNFFSAVRKGTNQFFTRYVAAICALKSSFVLILLSFINFASAASLITTNFPISRAQRANFASAASLSHRLHAIQFTQPTQVPHMR